jgi:glycosyltransferase involved in cell wall biosynthesis
VSFRSSDWVFVLLAFEGPDAYSQAGGLGVREKELSRVLAGLGYETHLFFIGDPSLPGEETQLGGRLHLHRWAQWLSRGHPGGVYDGEDAKIDDWDRSLPDYLQERVLTPVVGRGLRLVVMAEEWQTARSTAAIARALDRRGIRREAVILWNANNLYGFDRIDWKALRAAATITTISRYMKQQLMGWQVPSMVIPNGIPAESIIDPPAANLEVVRRAAAADLFCVKIGRFDPDKRWLMAVAALAELKRRGLTVRLLMRGSKDAHGRQVLAEARRLGLSLADEPAPQSAADLASLLRRHGGTDVVNLVSFLPEPLLGTVYAAADAVLANSGHEPFGLVGLEVMAAGGLAVTGSTGEDYAVSLRNALVMETDDPLELVNGLDLVRGRPALARRLRREGRRTARAYQWRNVVEDLFYRVELAGLLQSAPSRAPVTSPRRSASRAAPERERAGNLRRAGPRNSDRPPH